MGKGGLFQSLKAGKAGTMALTVPIKDLKSRESGLDDNAHKALKASENPEIRFTLKSLTLKAKEGEAGTLTAKGKLTIAGVTVPVTLSGEATIKGDRIEFKGTQALKMSDFKIKPPSISLVVTSIDCTDDVTVHFDVILAPAAK
jgi:polyisoprenoid-binding protein YceI